MQSSCKAEVFDVIYLQDLVSCLKNSILACRTVFRNPGNENTLTKKKKQILFTQLFT